MKAITVNEWVSETWSFSSPLCQWSPWQCGPALNMSSGSLQPDMPELGLVLPFAFEKAWSSVRTTFSRAAAASQQLCSWLQSSCQRPCLPISTCTVVLAFSFFLFLFNSAAAGPATQSALRNLAKNLCICRMSLKRWQWQWQRWLKCRIKCSVCQASIHRPYTAP